MRRWLSATLVIIGVWLMYIATILTIVVVIGGRP